MMFLLFFFGEYGHIFHRFNGTDNQHFLNHRCRVFRSVYTLYAQEAEEFEHADEPHLSIFHFSEANGRCTQPGDDKTTSS